MTDKKPDATPATPRTEPSTKSPAEREVQRGEPTRTTNPEREPGKRSDR